MPDESPPPPKLAPLDYAFMIGGPILFLLIAIFGMRAVIGPIPQPSPVQRIKDEEIKPGMTLSDVLHRLGKPKDIQTRDDGSQELIYTRTVSDGELTLEEGVIDFGTSGTVVGTHVDRQTAVRSTPNTVTP